MTGSNNHQKNSNLFKKRKLLFFAFAALKLIFNQFSRKSANQVKTILVYPEVFSKKELADLTNRIAWGAEYEDVQVHITVNNDMLDTDCKELTPPVNQRNYLEKSNLTFKLITKTQAKKLFSADSIFLHDYKKLFKLKFLLRIRKIEIVDQSFFSVAEPNVWRNFHINLISKSEREKLRANSIQNFENLKSKIKSDKSYCFTSGPSFDRYREFTFEKDSFKIICNSIVKNRDFLDYIVKPDLLVFADPVFHFSPCEYAALFRDTAKQVIIDYDCYFMLPEPSLSLILQHYPELKSKAIGMPAKKRSSIHFPTLNEFWVKSSDNILTYFMLPVASSFTEKIYVIGADGRQKSEKYFWKHSTSVQFDLLMQTVFDTHPSFFRDRDYADYFDKHCKYLDKLLSYGEKEKNTYYSLTPSYIPALNKRLLK